MKNRNKSKKVSRRFKS